MSLLLRLLKLVPPSWIRAGIALRGRYPLVKRATNWLPDLLRNREGVIQSGLGRGLRFNGGNSAAGFILGTHDTIVQLALSRLLRPGATVYDVGANVGFTAVLAARCVGETGRVVAFEPLPNNAAQIRVNADLNGFARVQVHQVAVGDADGDAEFRVSAAPTWGRLAGAGATPEQCGTTRVPVCRLDTLVASGACPDPHFIKMDVEGAEAAALTGGRSVLTRAMPVMVIELHHTYQAVVGVLSGLDYVIRPLVPGGHLASTDGEFQVLVYPTGHTEGEALWAALVAREKLVFA